MHNATRGLMRILLISAVSVPTGCSRRSSEPSADGERTPVAPVPLPSAVQTDRSLVLRNPHINPGHFAVIRRGMTLDEVVEILGPFSGSAVVTERTPTEGQWRLWEDESEGPRFRKVIQIRFVAGRVEEKISEGLPRSGPEPAGQPGPTQARLP